MKKQNIVSQNIRLGDTVEVLIQKVLPIGLQVKLPNGGQGLIRAREICWDESSSRATWDETYETGHYVRALILEREEDYLELSLRLVDADPWKTIRSRYPDNHVFDGVVQGIVAYGAFIQLEPGVTGLLHKTELPEWAEGSVEELLWVGDLVKVSVKSIESENRRIRLSMRDQRTLRWQDLETSRVSPSHKKGENAIVVDEYETSNVLVQNQRRLRKSVVLSVVLVEDNQAQRRAVAQWLRSSGHAVFAVESAEEALEVLERTSPDVVLSDLDLPGMDGLRMLRVAAERHPKATSVLMTAWTSASERKEELEQMQMKGLCFLVKPLLPDDLATLFDDIVLNDLAAIEHEYVAVDPIDEKDGNLPWAGQKRGASKQQKELRRLLRKAQRATGAQNIVLFRLDTAKRQVEATAQVGMARLNRGAFPSLVHSPVRDAAEDGTIVLIQDLQQNERYGLNLQPLLSFQSCIGHPVESLSADDYAVFYFFTDKKAVTPSIERYVDVAALAMGAKLNEQMLQQHLTDSQRTGLMGTLASGFVHEINHHLGPLKFAIESLDERCLAVREALVQNPQSVDGKMLAATDTLHKLGAGVDNLVKIARSFSQMGVQDQNSIVRVDQAAERSIKLVLDAIGYQHIRILLHAPDQILYTYGKPAQLQQVFVNLILNAAQQVLAARPAIGGQVHVQLERLQKDGQTYICTMVKDDGPGIHHRLWEEIFELGYTSRSGAGSGLGLYIARSLVEDMGGRVEVKNSYQLWGSCLLVELPVYVA